MTGQLIEYDVGDRREGDPAVLVADSSYAVDMLGWQLQYENLDEIIDTAWLWHKKDSQIRR